METEKYNKLSQYEQLVEEMLKKKPDEMLVKSLMLSLGIKYSAHNIDRLSAVLAYSPITPSHKGETNDL